jgi:Kef-type K+ transport system membrane component KefB
MGLSAEVLLIILSSLVVLSYGFSIISQYIKIPSVLLLLFAGMGFRLISNANNITIHFPENVVEGLGVIGLIMIVLEAGLDLKLEASKKKLISRSFFAAMLILIISTAFLAGILYFWLKEEMVKCIVYALPLSIMSSSIVLPSIHPLTADKKEFLIYEASFSDILGIIFFNYFTAREILTLHSFGVFGLSLVSAVVLSLVLSFLLFLILARTRMGIKFFLIFSLLILIYAGGKLLHLPSLIIILVFGLMINNWDKIPWKKTAKIFPPSQVEPLRELLHSITAESSFLIRTFFFILFGYSIDLSFISNTDVILVGSGMVAALFLVRFLYLRFFLHEAVFPEVFFIPRGLITIVLFYKIPNNLKLVTFNEGILFFIILSTSVILSLGMVFYRQRNNEIIEEPLFPDRKDIL